MSTVSQQPILNVPRGMPLSVRPLLALLSRLRYGAVHGTLPDGRWFFVSGREPGPEGSLRLHRPLRLLGRVMRRGAIGLAESYMAGDWSSPAPADLLEVLAVNERSLERQSRYGPLTRWRLRRYHARRRNTLKGSRRNIEAHYDLGNDFYRLWLDPSMTYSGAEFQDPAQELEAAQHHKLARILDLLPLKPDAEVLEIGCGWGGLALAAGRRGARVTGVTLSRQQLDHARAAVAQAGLKERIELRLQDYRDIPGQFDHIVSVEMLEAVGEPYWPVYFDTLAARLRPGGSAVLHGITIQAPYFERYRGEPDFIQRYIFPGGMLPTLDHLRDQASRVGLRVTRVDSLGEHYARTLTRWHQQFMARIEDVRALGYDERFIRMWRYYLAYCEAGFRTGRIDLHRLRLEKP